MKIEILRKLEGLQTLETVQEALKIKKQSARNLLTKMKKEGHMTLWAKGRKPMYKITMRKQRKRDPGMFDLLNACNPSFKLNEWYDHQVHGRYTVEDAIVDAVKTKSFRTCLATLHCFNHITDWKQLYHSAKEKDCWREVGALYDVARIYLKVKKMPERYRKQGFGKNRLNESWKLCLKLEEFLRYPGK